MFYMDVRRVILVITSIAIYWYFNTYTFAYTFEDNAKTQIENQILHKINRHRLNYHLAPLSLDHRLSASARYKSIHMKENEYYSHTSPVHGEFYNIPYMFGHTGAVGEVIHGLSHECIDSIIYAWLNSPSHRELILHPDARSAGVGIGVPYTPFIVALNGQYYLISGLTTVHFGF